MQMDYVREAIKYLESYNDLEKSKENLAMTIRELKAITGEKPANLNGMPHGSSSINFDDKLINNMYRLQVAEKNFKDTVKEMKRIDKILEELDKDIGEGKHGTLLRKWFIENETKEKIAEDLNISVRHAFRIKNVAIRRLAIQLHGINAVK